MYDAVNAIDGRYSVFAVRPTSSARRRFEGSGRRDGRLSRAARRLSGPGRFARPGVCGVTRRGVRTAAPRRRASRSAPKSRLRGSRCARTTVVRPPCRTYSFGARGAGRLPTHAACVPERGRAVDGEDAAVRDDEPVAVSRVWPAGPHERALRARPCDGAGARRGEQHRAHGRGDGDREVLHGKPDDLLLAQPARVRGDEELGRRPATRACSRRCS